MEKENVYSAYIESEGVKNYTDSKEFLQKIIDCKGSSCVLVEQAVAQLIKRVTKLEEQAK